MNEAAQKAEDAIKSTMRRQLDLIKVGKFLSGFSSVVSLQFSGSCYWIIVHNQPLAHLYFLWTSMLLIAICGLAQALIVKRVQHRVNELKVLLKSSRAIQAEQPGSNRFWNAIEQYEAASKNLGCPVQFTLPKHDE